MKIGIVIANWNGEKVIGICLESLLAQTYKNFKIYIVDNGSSDKSFEIIDKYKNNMDISVTKLPENIGFAPANNIGIDQAINDGNDYIFTLNNDTDLEKECISNTVNFINGRKNKKEFYQLFIINYFERDVCDCAGMKIDDYLIPSQLGFKEKISDKIKSIDKIDGVCAGAAFYSSTSLKELRAKYGYYFDETFVSYYEDVDISLRLKKTGNVPIFISNAIVYHVHSATGNKISGFKEYYLARNLFIYTRKNQSKEEYNKHKIKYYKIILYKIKMFRKDRKVIKEILRGLKDSRKILKKINRSNNE